MHIGAQVAGVGGGGESLELVERGGRFSGRTKEVVAPRCAALEIGLNVLRTGEGYCSGAAGIGGRAAGAVTIFDQELTVSVETLRGGNAFVEREGGGAGGFAAGDEPAVGVHRPVDRHVLAGKQLEIHVVEHAELKEGD